jgi:hypothetical protein
MCYFLEARLEITSARALFSTNNSCRAALVYLKRAGKQLR